MIKRIMAGAVGLFLAFAVSGEGLKLSELPTATVVGLTNIVPVVTGVSDGMVTKKATLAVVADAIIARNNAYHGSFTGNGAGLTNPPATWRTNAFAGSFSGGGAGLTNVGGVAVGNGSMTTTGTVTAATFAGSGASLTGILPRALYDSATNGIGLGYTGSFDEILAVWSMNGEDAKIEFWRTNGIVKASGFLGSFTGSGSGVTNLGGLRSFATQEKAGLTNYLVDFAGAYLRQIRLTNDCRFTNAVNAAAGASVAEGQDRGGRVEVWHLTRANFSDAAAGVGRKQADVH